MIQITNIPFPEISLDPSNDFHNLWIRIYKLNDYLKGEIIKDISINWSDDEIVVEFESGEKLEITAGIFKYEYKGESF